MGRAGEVGLCLVRCCHCGILFLADRRNHNRENLGCPFGCREAHRRRASAARSMAYYRTESGRRKKQDLNARRSATGASEPLREGVAGRGVPDAEGDGTVRSGRGECGAVGESESETCAMPPEAEVRDGLGLVGVGLETTGSAARAVGTPGSGPFSPVLVAYLQMVIGRIEGRPVSAAEIRELLAKVLRQRRYGVRPKREYVLSYLAENPP